MGRKTDTWLTLVRYTQTVGWSRRAMVWQNLPTQSCSWCLPCCSTPWNAISGSFLTQTLCPALSHPPTVYSVPTPNTARKLLHKHHPTSHRARLSLSLSLSLSLPTNLRTVRPQVSSGSAWASSSFREFLTSIPPPLPQPTAMQPRPLLQTPARRAHKCPDAHCAPIVRVAAMNTAKQN